MVVFQLFSLGEYKTRFLLAYAAGLSRELLAIVVVMTAYQLTISLQLICEDFMVIGAIKRKRWLWCIPIGIFILRVISTSF